MYPSIRHQIKQSTIFVPTNQAFLKTGALSTATGVALASGQLGLYNAAPESATFKQLLPAGTVMGNTSLVSLLQGTPKSANSKGVNSFYGHKQYVASAEIEANKVLSISYTPYKVPTLSVQSVTVTGAEVDEAIPVGITFRGPAAEKQFTKYKLPKVITEIMVPSSTTIPVANYAMQAIASKLNAESIVAKPFGTPFVILALGTGGTTVNLETVVVGDSIPVLTNNGSTKNFVVTKEFIASLQGKTLGATTVVNLTATPSATFTVSELLVVGLPVESEILGVQEDADYDNSIRVEFFGQLDTDIVEVSGVRADHNSGKAWKQFYRRQMRPFAHTMEMENFGLTELPFYSYIDEDALYSNVTIRYRKNVESHNHDSVHEHEIVILLKTAITDLATSTPADASFTVALTDTTTVTDVKAVLGAYFNSIPNIEYTNQAVKGTIIP